MEEAEKTITQMVINYKEDLNILSKICKLISKIKNSRVKVRFEEMFVDELMTLNSRIKGLEEYLDDAISEHKEDCSCFNCSLDPKAIKARKELDDTNSESSEVKNE